jgi:hypothetical protein
MHKWLIAFYGLILFLLVGCGPVTPVLPTKTPVAVSVMIASLNRWASEYAEFIDIVMCPSRHPSVVDMGQMTAAIFRSKKKLKDLGVYVRWNCATQSFEITTEESQKSLCECP